MKKQLLFLFVSFCFFGSSYADNPEVFTRKGLTLVFKNNSPDLNADLKMRMVNTFFEVYPKLAETYNPATLKKVTFSVDTAYKGVAATGGGNVVFNPEWFKKHPGDIDVVTHEVMHIVQNYGNGAGPGWLTEGIADYVRYTFGVDNAGAGWSLTPFKAEQSYKNAYRITARFLHWIELKKSAGIVKKLDAALRSHTYTADIWKENTGSTIDELWTLYSADPSI